MNLAISFQDKDVFPLRRPVRLEKEVIQPMAKPVFVARISSGRYSTAELMGDVWQSLDVIRKESDVEGGPAWRVETLHASLMQPNLEQNAEPIHRFAPSRSVIESFASDYNGRGFQKLRMWFLDSQITDPRAEQLLSSIVEDALLATFNRLMSTGGSSYTLRADEESVLLHAIERRIPRLQRSKTVALARQIVAELVSCLALGRRLLVDGGSVSILGGRIHAEVSRETVARHSSNRHGVALQKRVA